MIQITFFQKQLLEYLVIHDEYLTIKEVASFFLVSERKIRYDLNHLEGILQQHAQILKIPSKGIKLICKDLKKLMEETSVVFSQQERVIDVLVSLYMGEELTHSSLELKYHVSKQTVYKDLDRLEKEFLGHNLILESDKKSGIILKGSEEDIRFSLLTLLNQEGVRKQFYTRLKSHNYVSKYLGGIHQITGKVIKKDIYEILPLILDVSKHRIKLGNSLNLDGGVKKEDEAYLLTKETFLLENPAEVYFVLKVVFLYTRDTLESSDCDETQERLRLADKVVQKLCASFKFKYDENDVTYQLLRSHLIETLARIERGETITNELKDEIKTGFPLTYEITYGVLMEHVPYAISSDEIAYITMYMKSISDKIKIFDRQIRIAIVCNFGHSTSTLLYHRLQSHFGGEYLMGLYSLKEYDEVKEKHDFDLVISTVVMQDKNTVFINPLLTNNDVYKLKQIIQKKVYEKQCQDILLEYHKPGVEKEESRLSDLIKEKHIQLGVEINDWKEAIQKASAPLLLENKISQSYVERMIWSIHTFGTYMVILPKIAFVHAAIEDGVQKRGISLLRLKEDIDFGENKHDKVRVIIVLASTEKEDLGILKLVSIFEKEDAYERLMNAETVVEIMEI